MMPLRNTRARRKRRRHARDRRRRIARKARMTKRRSRRATRRKARKKIRKRHLKKSRRKRRRRLQQMQGKCTDYCFQNQSNLHCSDQPTLDFEIMQFSCLDETLNVLFFHVVQLNTLSHDPVLHARSSSRPKGSLTAVGPC